MTRFRRATPLSARAALVAEGETLAALRREHLFALIKEDPAAALAAAVPMARRADLPESIQTLLEERVSGRAFFSVQVADDFESHRREVRREVVVNQQRYEAYVYGARVGQMTQTRVPLWGIAVRTDAGRRLAVHQERVRRLEPGEPSPPATGHEFCPVSNRPSTLLGTETLAEVAGEVERFCGTRHVELLNLRLAADAGFSAAGFPGPHVGQTSWSQGPKTCLFMRVAFPDDPAEPISEDGAYALLDGVNQWYVENSYATTSITPAVTPLLMLPQTKAWYGVQGTGTLLADAHAAALVAGYDPGSYDWEMVRHNTVPGAGFGWSGLAQVHGKGIWLQSSALSVACHELGHNYGLWHANSWSAGGDSVIGPGANLEYGNIFDTMSTVGAGNNQFNVAFKNQLDWLPERFVQSVTASGIYRLHVYDVPSLAPGQTYALKVRKNYGRNYWAEFRQKFSGNPWLQNGILLNWDPWNNGVANSAGGTQLLDTTPGTQTGNNGKDDAAVICGRTFSDPGADVHLTPVTAGGAGLERWIDVSVQLGPFPGNAPPAVALTADRTSAGVNVAVHFDVAASDPDGDPLAYAWDFGDDTFGPNAPTATKAWPNAGDYVVRCVVSDMRGGLSSQKLVVTVGTPGTFQASGRITAADGTPIEGARLHNGLSGASYHGTYSDSDGHYVLANLPAGPTVIACVKYGLHFTQAGWANPVILEPSIGGLDWVGVPDPVVSVTAVNDASGEGDAVPGRFRITRIGPTNTALAVKFNRTGSAFVGIDYLMSPALVGAPVQAVLPAGTPSLDIVITPLSDMLSEGPETVTLSLAEDAAYVLGSPAEATVRIADEDPPAKPTVNVSAYAPAGPADNLGVESGLDGGTFAFTRTGSVENELVVYYAVSGTATPDVDYPALPGVLTIPANETVTLVSFVVFDDAEREGDETVVVTILADPAYDGGGATDSITIVDDDPPTVYITATDSSGREAGSSGTFTMTRAGSLAANLVVRYALGGTASNSLDFAALPGAMTIPAGRAAASVTVTPLNDGAREGDETVVATLLSSAAYNVGAPGSATITIQDDELPTVTLAPSDPSASEPGADTGTFTFSRSGATTEPLTVRFGVAGTAINGADYTFIDNVIVIPAGASSASLPIVPLDDAVKESDEKVTLLLSPDPAYNVGTAGAQSVTIKDDDAGLPGVGFTFAASSGAEQSGLARLSVGLSTNAPGTVTVSYAVTGGTATGGGVDYILAAGTLSFPPGTLSQSINLFVINDTLVESNETIVVTLTNPVNAVLDAISEHTYTILDDDRSGVVTVIALDPSAAEHGLDPGMFRVSRSGDTNEAQPVFFQLVGTASSPSDYQPIPSPVIIPAGAAFVDIPVVPVDDETDESDETVVLHLIRAPGAQIGSPDLAIVTILDDDDSSLLPVVTVEATDPLSSEPGNDPARFTIRRTGDTNADLTIGFSLVGTATSGADYVAVGPTVVIPAGSAQADVTVTPRDDPTFEGDETIVLTLTQLPAYRVGVPASASALLVDNEIGVSIVALGASAEDGSELGQFVITRTGSVASNLTVRFLEGGTADLDDFISLGNSAIIPAGTNAVALPVWPINDDLPEGNETVVLTLLGGAAYTVVSPGNATLTILDDEPAVSVVARDPIAYEGDGSHAVFTITRSGVNSGPLAVFYTLSGTAGNGLDYQFLPDTAVIPAGESSVDLEVLPINDSEIEGNETVQLTLRTNEAYAVAIPSSTLITLLDDELNLPPVVTIASPLTDTVFLSDTANALVLEADAADDGRPNPPGTLTIVWKKVSGPGSTTFGSSSALRTTVRFSTNGIYVLRCSADDGELSAWRDLTVVIEPETALSAGLQAHWSFDETAGTTAADGSGNGREATLTGGAAFARGRFNQGLELDGLDDSASFASMSLTQLTVSAWIRADSAGNSLTPRVVAMPGYNIRVRRDPAATTNAVALESERSETPGEWRSPGNVVTDGTWSHIAVTYDSSRLTNAPQFFINGALKPGTRRVAPVGTQLANAGPGALGNSPALDRGWDGGIDEVRIYNRLLSPAEIHVLADGPLLNLAPVVSTGPPQSVEFGTSALLSGSVRDDGYPPPPDAIATRWTKISGPGSVTFEAPDRPETSASFSAGGLYLLRLTADDGQVKVAADIRITVTAPAIVDIQAVDRTAAEFGAQGSQGSFGLFTLHRSGDLSASLTVHLSIAGTASNGVDYLPLTDIVSFPVNTATLSIPIVPIRDGLPEGEETVRLAILEGPGYLLGAPAADTVFLEDAPWDQWRLDHFSAAQLAMEAVSGPLADPDGDHLVNLLEYAFGLDPASPDVDAGLHGAFDNAGEAAGLRPADAASAAQAGQPAFVVQYHRRLAPTDLVYELESSTDCVTWSGGANLGKELLPRITDSNGETETVRVQLPDNADHRRFVRLKVWLQSAGRPH